MINYQGLKNGVHLFDFSVDEGFFENPEELEFQDAQIQVKVELQRDTTMMVFLVEISGSVQVTCDRCLEEFRTAVQSNNRLIVNFGEEENFDDEVMITLLHTEYEIDLAPFIREYVLLSIPMKRTCTKNSLDGKKCDQEMIHKLKELKGKTEPENKEEEADPRWDALRNIKFD